MVSSPTKQEKNAQTLMALEKNLHVYLKPVNPNPEFIHRLENRLNNYPRISVERRSQMGLFLMIIGSLITCLSVFWILWRFYFRRS